MRALRDTFNQEIPYRTTTDQKKLIELISISFENYLKAMFSNFKHYTICSMDDPTRPISAFMKESFIEDIPEPKAFVVEFLETQIFSHYSERIIRKREKEKAVCLPTTFVFKDSP